MAVETRFLSNKSHLSPLSSNCSLCYSVDEGNSICRKNGETLGECVLPLNQLQHLIDQRDWEQARQELEWLLVSGRLDPAQRCLVHRHGCRVYSWLQQYYAAVKHGEIALGYAAVVGDHNTQTRVLFDLGHAHLWLGNSSDAVDKLHQFIEHMQTGHFNHLAGKAWLNLGIAYRISNRLSEAVGAHACAVRAYEELQDTRGAAKALIGGAWCHLLQGEHLLAGPILADVHRGLSADPDDELEGHLTYCQALYLRQIGEQIESQQLCRSLWATHSEPEIVAAACWIAGENALDGGRLEEACRLANLALECSKQCPFPSIIEQAYQLYHRTRAELEEEEELSL